MSAYEGYPTVRMLIGDVWRMASDGSTRPVVNPATEEVIGAVPVATRQDLDAALAGVERGFEVWCGTPPHSRYKIMRKAAELLAERAEPIARTMTLEQGKPLAQSLSEVTAGADMIDWFAEEARRVTHTVLPGRAGTIDQTVLREPIGPVAAFTPWNFPVNQAVRKIAAALAAGCSILLKGPEDTPASCMELVAAFVDAGVPPGVVGLVFGEPAEISAHLIAHPIIRKVSFTGSTAVGKQLAALAGAHMKPVTMELGGHGPVLVYPDVDVKEVVGILSAAKFRNAGQICTAPTRFLVHEDVRDSFTENFVAAASKVRVGDGTDSATDMGPLAHDRRVAAIESLVADAVQRGARLLHGGHRIGDRGYFFAPTVLMDTPLDARIMNEEPFGPVALINSYCDEEHMIAEANRLPYGLASYLYARSVETARRVAARLSAGMVSVNHQGLGLPETPFGGIKDSGHGNEGGIGAIDAYMVPKFVTHRILDA